MSFLLHILFIVFLVQHCHSIYASHSNQNEISQSVRKSSQAHKKEEKLVSHHQKKSHGVFDMRNEEGEEIGSSFLSRTRHYFNDEKQHFTVLPTWREKAALLLFGVMMYAINSYLNPVEDISQILDMRFVDMMSWWLIMEVFQNVTGQGKKWVASKIAASTSSKSTKRSLLKDKHYNERIHQKIQFHENKTRSFIDRSLLCASNFAMGGALLYSMWNNRDIHFGGDSVAIALPPLVIPGLLCIVKGVDDIRRLLRVSSHPDFLPPRNWEYLLNSFGLACLGSYKTIFDHSHIKSHANSCMDDAFTFLTQRYLKNPFFDHSEKGLEKYILAHQTTVVDFCTEQHYLKMHTDASFSRNLGRGLLLAQVRSVLYDIAFKMHEKLSKRPVDIIDAPRTKRAKRRFISDEETRSLQNLVQHINSYAGDQLPLLPAVGFSAAHRSYMRELKISVQEKLDRDVKKKEKKNQREKNERPLELPVYKKRKEGFKSFREKDPSSSDAASSKPILSEKQARKFQQLKKAIHDIEGKTNITPLEFNRILNLAAHFGFKTEGKKASGNQTLEMDDKIIDGLHPIHGTNRVEAGRMRVLFTLFDAIKDKYGDAD